MRAGHLCSLPYPALNAKFTDLLIDGSPFVYFLIDFWRVEDIISFNLTCFINAKTFLIFQCKNYAKCLAGF